MATLSLRINHVFENLLDSKFQDQENQEGPKTLLRILIFES